MKRFNIDCLVPKYESGVGCLPLRNASNCSELVWPSKISRISVLVDVSNSIIVRLITCNWLHICPLLSEKAGVTLSSIIFRMKLRETGNWAYVKEYCLLSHASGGLYLMLLPTKIQLCNSLVLSVLLYECDSRTMTADRVRRIHAFENKCNRRMLGISYREHKTN